MQIFETKKNKIIAISLFIVFLAAIVFSVFLYFQNKSYKNIDKIKKQDKIEQKNLVADEVVSSVGGIDSAPDTNTSSDCNGGKSDDYLHPERFINPDGTLKCAEGVVIFDHQITPKFIRTIIPYIEDETGVTIDFNDIDFYITLLETGETVVFEDIFYWYEDGQRTIFNTNELLWEKWRDYIEGNKTYTFGVSMIHRPTNTEISVIFKDHTTMTLRFDGME